MSRIDLYFFDGQHKRKKWKRYRKPPELLPFSVRLTGLSGAVRVEAYLKQQQRAGESKNKENTPDKTVPEKPENTAEETAGLSGGEQNQAVLNNLYKLSNDLKEEFEDKKLDKRAFRLPTIGLKHFQGTSGIKSFEQLEGDDEEEDTQRFLFEENKFAAPNLLAQLAKLLDFIHGKQVEELQEIISTSSQLNGSVTPSVIVEEPEPEVTETLQAGGILIPLPDDLASRLLNNYEGLSASAVYVKREWQTTSYREQAILQNRLGLTPMNSQRNLLEGSKLTDAKNTMVNPKGDLADKPKASESKDSIRKKKSDSTTEVNKRETDSVDIPGTPATIDSTNDAPQILSYRRDSRNSSIFPRPKTRLERFKYYTDKTDGSGKLHTLKRSSQYLNVNQKINVGPHEHFAEDEDFKDSDVPSVQVSTPTTINFSLLSKTCEDKGWIIHQDEANDLERQTMIEWAWARLMQTIKEKNDAAGKAKELGEDGPVVQKFYGDAQLEAALKYKKGVSWAKRWKKMTEDEKKMKFVITVPDGTTYCYYPSGRVAICAINPGPGLPGKYTLVYGDTESQPLLAAFTPSGMGCTYHNNGSIKFVATSKYGSVMEEDGHTDKKWKWPLGKLQTAVVVQVNPMITLRCVSQSSIALYFSCQNESIKFQVGMTTEAKSLKVEELGYLQTATDYNFTSLSALQSIKVKPKRREGQKRKKASKQAKTDVITEEVLEQRHKELEEKFPERRELDIDAPWQIDLFRLQRKVKNLVYDWMEHYRISVGITSPCRAASRARRRSLAHSARSVPGTLPSSLDPGRRSPYDRSPSAPPIPRAKALATFLDEPGSPSRAKSSTNRARTGKALGGEGAGRAVTLDVQGTDGRGTTRGKAPSAVNGSPTHSRSPSRTPFRCGVIQQQRPITPPKHGCCVALRADMIGEMDAQCRCDRRKIPLVTDLEYDIFIREHVPRTQLLVVSVTSSVYADANPCDAMLDQLFYEKNRNRSIPCVQARNDPFRLLRYDIATAARRSTHTQPLLLRRHNAVPGMFLMYTGGKLLFADHIFNGYGNAKKDFLKQIIKTRKEALEGKALPSDFRLSPTRGRSGMRAAWGGEIGGLKMSSPQEAASCYDTGIPRIASAVSDTISSTTIDLRGGGRSSASFVNLGLSINSPYPIATKRIESVYQPVRDVHTVA